MIQAGDEGVEAFLHRSLDSHMRKALQVPMGEAVQLV
jgi:hypothetical protein